MRVLKTIYLVVLFSLSTGLFFGELPETLRLRDDTSNDYVNDSNANTARETAKDREETVPEKRAASDKSPAKQVSPTPSAGPATLSGQKLLEQLSVRRT